MANDKTGAIPTNPSEMDKDVQPERDQTKGTDKPWDRAGQASQDPAQKMPGKPDLERWQRSKTH